MLQQSKKRQAGFTIIEVLIVLAIAGLIMLIVFLAVPALQRNSRNTQVRSAASGILAAVNEYSTNNNGQLPTTVSVAADGTVTVQGAAGTSPSQAKVQAGYVASFVDGSSGTCTMPASTGTYVVCGQQNCNGNAFSGTTTKRAVSIGFLVESGSTNPAQCIQS